MENIDVLDEEGNNTGEIRSIDEVHAKGFWHRTVHIWLVNSKNEILLQHRSKTMQICPDMWGVSTGGHISAGENPEIAAQREVKEEIGVDVMIHDLKIIGKAIYQDTHPLGSDNEFQNIYLVKGDFSLEDFKMNKVEVQGIKFIPIPEFFQWVKNKKSDLIIHGHDYNSVLFQALENF